MRSREAINVRKAINDLVREAREIDGRPPMSILLAG